MGTIKPLFLILEIPLRVNYILKDFINVIKLFSQGIVVS